MNQLLFQHISQALVMALFSNLLQGLLIIGIIWLLRKYGNGNRYPALLYVVQLSGLFFLAGSLILQCIAGFAETTPAWIIKNLWVDQQQTIQILFPLLATFYLLGLVFHATSWIRSWSKLAQIRISEKNERAPVLYQAFVRQWAAVMGIQRAVRVLISNRISIPMTYGFLRPVILVPMCSITQLNENQLKTILLHELAHIRRKDYLVNILQQAAATLLYFNPAAKWLNDGIQETREWLCDEEVLQFPYSPREYAEALYTLSSNYQPLTPAMRATGSSRHLLTRIQKIMTPQSSAPRKGIGNWLLGGWMLLMISLALLFTPTGFSTSKTKKVPQSEPQFSLQLFPIWPAGFQSKAAGTIGDAKLPAYEAARSETAGRLQHQQNHRKGLGLIRSIDKERPSTHSANEYVLTLINEQALQMNKQVLSAPQAVHFNENGLAQLSDSTWMIRVEEQFSGENSQRVTYYQLLKTAEKSQLIPLYQTRKLSPSASETAH